MAIPQMKVSYDSIQQEYFTLHVLNRLFIWLKFLDWTSKNRIASPIVIFQFAKKTQSCVHCFGKGNLLLMFGLKIHKIVVSGLQLLDYSDSSKTKLRSVLRLQYTFGSVIFFKFGFLGQNSGRRIISNF